MAKLYLAVFLLMTFFLPAEAGNLEDIRLALEQSAQSQVQEKVYVHTDNQCYFVGDTLWYKAYVVRADNLHPTDMSRLLYVELLSPDGLLVERQTVIVSPTGFSCGQFALRDSLYSGYYELRAYTRWMLNFNVRHHTYRKDETWWFYNRQMAADYHRIWDGLYSRVLPVYSKPDTPGDYDARRMYQRPKTRLPRQKKDDLQVTFYPEGGHLVQGVQNRVAFEVTDQHGQAVSISGMVSDGQSSPIRIATQYMGRGSFTVTPTDRRLTASFTWRDKKWNIRLPEAEVLGATLRLDGHQLAINGVGLPAGKRYALSILCRGVLKHFQEVELKEPAVVTLPLEQLPTGVADVTLFDDDGRILADRLFFVNHHENDAALITTPVQANQTYAPYQRIDIPVKLEGVSAPTTFSLSIRDTYTDEPTYDNGNLMTDLLLSSELKGFIAYPAHYFEKDDEEHRQHLDLLMMVQGWRKYKWEELADKSHALRYTPETTLTIEGGVYKMLDIIPVGDLPGDPPPGVTEIDGWQFGRYNGGRHLTQKSSSLFDDDEHGSTVMVEETESDGLGIEAQEDVSWDTFDYLVDPNASLGVNHSNLRRDVLVEAELNIDGQFVAATQRTKGGHFVFEVPPFYGLAYLNMKAFSERDSTKKNMLSRKDKSVLDEDAFPDYYVKRDLFYPIYTHDYTYYEKHQPDYTDEMLLDTLSELSMENDVHQLGNINVRGHRRGRRAVDWKKPAFVMDAYDLYNDITDRGLSFGKLDMRKFPVQVCKYLFGSMNYSVDYNVDGRIEGHTYYRNYSPFVSGSEAEEAGLFVANRTPQYLYNRLKLKRLLNIRVFTDYEPRTEDSLMVHEEHSPDATVDLELIPYEGVQPTFRDRHILFRGINEADDFYQPDYSSMAPGDLPADYRRTLYWNPNAVSDEQGCFTATFYNNGKETRISMSAAGIDADGRLLHSR